MIIDSHIHVNFLNMNLFDIVDYMDNQKIDQCWLLTWEEINPAVQALYQNLSIENVLEAYNIFPDRFIPMYAPDPHIQGFYDKLLTYKNKGIKGCGELKIPLMWNSKEIHNLLSCLRRLNFPLIFHMEQSSYRYIPDENNRFDLFLRDIIESKVFNGRPRLLIERLKKIKYLTRKKTADKIVKFLGYLIDFIELEKRIIEYDDVIFIGHGPWFWKNISAQYLVHSIHDRGPIEEEGLICEFLEKYENLYADLSGTSGFNALNRDREFAKRFLEKFYKKILFGTDNCKLGLKQLIDSLGLSKKKLNYIYGSNANDLIRT